MWSENMGKEKRGARILVYFSPSSSPSRSAPIPLPAWKPFVMLLLKKLPLIPRKRQTPHDGLLFSVSLQASAFLQETDFLFSFLYL